MKKKFWEDDDSDSSDTTRSTSKEPPRKTGSLGIADSAEVDRKLHETQVLMNQTHQLYLHYFNGVEKRPPSEKARLLESKIKELERLTASVTSARFKMSQFILQYKTFRELWDRKLRDREKS